MEDVQSSSVEAVDSSKSVRGFVVMVLLLLTSFAMSWLAEVDLGGARNRLQSYYALWPQQWSFFVDLDTKVLEGYRLTPGTTSMSNVNAPEATSTAWGLARRPYAVGAEIREIAFRVPDGYWQTCDRSAADECGSMLNEAMTYRVDSPVRRPHLCGRLVVVVKHHVLPPPGQLHASDHAHRLALVDVTCPS